MKSHKDNNDNAMHVSMWFELFGGLLDVKKTMIYGREMWQQGGRFNNSLKKKIYSSFLA